MLPLVFQRARSPVRYRRDPGAPNGSATNRSAVRSVRPAYPRASWMPPRYRSPAPRRHHLHQPVEDDGGGVGDGRPIGMATSPRCTS